MNTATAKKIAHAASQMEFQGQGKMGSQKWNQFALDMWALENDKALSPEDEKAILALM